VSVGRLHSSRIRSKARAALVDEPRLATGRGSVAPPPHATAQVAQPKSASAITRFLLENRKATLLDGTPRLLLHTLLF
jgi:hypothetical protein